MIRIIDTYSQIGSLFGGGEFDLDEWESYISSIYENSADLFKNDLKEYLESGNYSFEKDFLPIINAVNTHAQLDALHTSFCKVINGLNERIAERIGVKLDVDVVLYLGLCNAAGWVTEINGRTVILLGIEKILELGWQDEDSICGLIYHELGHVYHKQHGIFAEDCKDRKIQFVWQLFAEGVAMYFEQLLVGDTNYYHQDKDGWLSWCDAHFEQIAADFDSDLPTMTRANQKYFGDWVSYLGKGDVGYYLGAKFVHFLRKEYDFEQIIKMNTDEIFKEYLAFVKAE